MIYNKLSNDITNKCSLLPIGLIMTKVQAYIYLK